MDIIEKIKNEIAVLEEKKKEFLKELHKELPILFQPIFTKSKKIESIGWRQYTPYFNDGDECTFRVSNSELIINGMDGEDRDEAIPFLDWRIKYYLNGDKEYEKLLIDNPQLDIEEYKVVCEFEKLLDSIPYEFYKALFGDHVTVTIHKSGEMETDDYEHYY